MRKTAWRESLLTKFSPPMAVGGMKFGRWRKLLRVHYRDIDSSYVLRAATMTLTSLINSGYGWCEDRLFGRKVAETSIQPPIFILGHWRGGTTHLHNLLAVDDRFAYPNTFQVSYPYTFLCTEAITTLLFGFLVPPTRPMDQVKISFQAAQEDEFALSCMTASPYVGFVFPRRQGDYEPFLTFRGVDDAIIAEWKSALTHFLKKLSWKYGRPLVLKSPTHTCRIRLLLELFPDARFIHIHRNPYEVFQSTCHMLRRASAYWNLQRLDLSHVEQRVLRIYRQMYDAFFEERALIPTGRFHEVGFAELEAEPMAQMRKLYQALDLPDFGHVEPSLHHYLETLSDYRKNSFPPMSDELRGRIAREWRQCFEEWGYPA